jgi:hypothetical protein
VRVLHINLQHVVEQDEQEEAGQPRPPPYPPPPLVAEQDRVFSEVKRILSRRSERRLSRGVEEGAIRRLSHFDPADDYSSPIVDSAPPQPSGELASRRLRWDGARISAASGLQAGAGAQPPPDLPGADRRVAELWSKMVKNAERRDQWS